MSIVERLVSHLENQAVDIDGEPQNTKLLPALNKDIITAIEKNCSDGLSEEVTQLLSFCGGIEDGPMELVDFKGQDIDWLSHPKLKGRMRLISPDGFGNFWFYWRTQTNCNLGPIYYFQHEGPMLFFQSPGLIDFVREYIRFMTPPYESLIDDVHEFRIKPLKNLNDDLITYDLAVTSSDVTLQEFARRYNENCFFFNLAAAPIGHGIDLRSLEIVAVHDTLPLFAVTKKAGFFKKLF